jgi:hypothetical protein
MTTPGGDVPYRRERSMAALFATILLSLLVLILLGLFVWAMYQGTFPGAPELVMAPVDSGGGHSAFLPA